MRTGFTSTRSCMDTLERNESLVMFPLQGEVNGTGLIPAPPLLGRLCLSPFWPTAKTRGEGMRQRRNRKPLN
jgi:hypothetical protein